MDKAQIIKELEKVRLQDEPRARELAEELYQLAETENDLELKGVALYYKGESYYTEDEKISAAILTDSLMSMSEENNPEECARANNMLAIYAAHREDYVASITYHLTCQKLCDNHELLFVGAMSASNLGFNFQNIGLYDRAIEYYHVAIRNLKKEGSEDAKEVIATLQTNLFICYYFLDNQEMMDETFSTIKEAADLILPTFSVPLFEAIVYCAKNDMAKALSKVKEAVALSHGEKGKPDYIDIYQFFCRFLYEHQFFESLEEVIDIVDEEIPHEFFPRIRVDFVKYRMACCESKNDYEGYRKAGNEYISLYENITAIYHKSISDAATLQLYINHLREAQETYEKEADTDRLTQLLNRNGLEKNVLPYFYEARERENQMGAIIIDIDYFKQYNDCYGHVLGDECIKMVANVIRSVCNSKAFAARFGGDEFVIICTDTDEQTVASMANTIVEKVRAVKLLSQDSPISDYVSVSVGYFTAIPEEGDALVGLVNLADSGLYLAKKQGRNQACIDRKALKENVTR